MHEQGAVRDEATLGRIKALVIPPAWEDVWISPDAAGHIQAVGTDAAGRRQYRYHDQWRAVSFLPCRYGTSGAQDFPTAAQPTSPQATQSSKRASRQK
jgi:DNA topoisomerase IB